MKKHLLEKYDLDTPWKDWTMCGLLLEYKHLFRPTWAWFNGIAKINEIGICRNCLRIMAAKKRRGETL